MDATYEVPEPLEIVDEYDSADLAAEGMPFETYLHQFMGQHAEWVMGRVYKMSPITRTHNHIGRFLTQLLEYYLIQTGAGELETDPFTMKLSENYSPQPDILVVTTPNLARLHETFLDGAADLIIEIVSKESINRDRGFKFTQYEKYGVREYWIIDPLREEVLFYVLDEDGLYAPQRPDAEGYYTSQVLPTLRLPVQLFFQNPLPHGGEAIEMVKAMLNQI